MLGIELVKDRITKEPAKAECAHVLETLQRYGPLVRQRRTCRTDDPLLSADVRNECDADFLLEVLDRALGSL